MNASAREGKLTMKNVGYSKKQVHQAWIYAAIKTKRDKLQKLKATELKCQTR